MNVKDESSSKEWFPCDLDAHGIQKGENDDLCALWNPFINVLNFLTYYLQNQAIPPTGKGL